MPAGTTPLRREAYRLPPGPARDLGRRVRAVRPGCGPRGVDLPCRRGSTGSGHPPGGPVTTGLVTRTGRWTVVSWYRNAVVYSLDVRTFQDSNGDGIGDLAGLRSRLDYLSRLGVTVLWLSPIHPSPYRDGGYDVTNYYDVDPSLGNLGDFTLLMNECDERGLRVMLDLVVNHTSDEHPWFTSARSDPRSPYRDWYVWSTEEPADSAEGMVFPGVQERTWTYDDAAGAWYHHRFYAFQPDLNTENPEVRAEILKVLAFWERLGVSGFRIDAAPFLVERTRPGGAQGRDYSFLVEIREQMSWLRGDAVLLAEANVPDEELYEFLGHADGAANRLQMLFAFRLNEALMLALAREDGSPVRDALEALPPLPRGGAWATFLRNHDEVDLSQLAEDERAEVMAAFGPDRRHQVYGRGIRRRLASMLGNDEARLRMAYSLQLTMPGTPVIRYGDEIGMGENLDLPEREAIRTPMQWSRRANGGFSTAAPDRLLRPVVDDATYGYTHVNVTDQRLEPDSTLSWFERSLHTLRECPEVGSGTTTVLTTDAGPAVLAHRTEATTGSMLFLHNLGEEDLVVRVEEMQSEEPVEVFADRTYGRELDLTALALAPRGFRWIRLRRGPADPLPGPEEVRDEETGPPAWTSA
ncbi:MAG: alpha-amylase family protein [Actinotalea sp.]|nr:alpha-amylase family protein [Actinotalea sp.]